MEKVATAYRFAGMAMVSELPLPELPPLEGAVRTAEVRIRLGQVPMQLTGAVEIDGGCFANAREYLLRVPGIAQYFVRDGREIIVQPEARALPLDVRAYLLGAVFVVLCHQRGMLPLHACAVSCGNGVSAFVGGSGQGKSSLAAHLAQRGFHVPADDICLVDTAADGAPMVIPAAPWLKLWRASLRHLGRPPEGLERVFSEDDKYRLPVEPLWEREPLARIFFLEKTETGAQVEIEELPRVHAIPRLMNLTHQAYLLQAIGLRNENFLRCGRVLDHATPYRLIRPWGLRYMETVVAAIAAFLEQK